MKKSLMVLTMLVALVGCDDATKAIDEAQAAANKAVDNL
ncbi:putative lipoprotein [Vibrio cholerae]|nr:putative lipoprotein [Vibrio cholerae]